MKGVFQLSDELKETDVVVVLFHDHGSRYVGKMFNDDWMRDRGFLEEEKTVAVDLVKNHIDKHLVTVTPNDPVSQGMLLMHQYKISQIPVVENGAFIGSVTEKKLFSCLLEKPELKELPIRNIMENPFPVVEAGKSIEDVSKLFTKEIQAVLVNYEGDKYHIITRQDVIQAYS